TNKLVTDKIFIVIVLNRNADVLVENDLCKLDVASFLWGRFFSSSRSNVKPLSAVANRTFSIAWPPIIAPPPLFQVGWVERAMVARETAIDNDKCPAFSAKRIGRAADEEKFAGCNSLNFSFRPSPALAVFPGLRRAFRGAERRERPSPQRPKSEICRRVGRPLSCLPCVEFVEWGASFDKWISWRT